MATVKAVITGLTVDMSGGTGIIILGQYLPAAPMHTSEFGILFDPAPYGSVAQLMDGMVDAVLATVLNDHGDTILKQEVLLPSFSQG